MYTYLYYLFALIVFPGLLFTIGLALFTQYLVRKISGRLQKRMGPSYVGPLGVLQPFYDVLKLLRAKEEVYHKFSSPTLAKFFGLVGLASGIVVLLMFPLSPFVVFGEFDFLVFVYFVSVWIPLSLVLMSLSMPGPYTSVGVSRYLSFVTIMEPSFFAAIFTPMVLTAKVGGRFSIYATSVNIHKLWLNPYTVVPLVLSLISLIVILQARSMFNPFNIPEAEQEIIAGYETEFSGPTLALAILIHDVEVALTALTIVYLVLGGPYPFRHLSIPGVATLIAKYVAVVLVSTIIRNTYGRFRLEQALKVLFKYAFIPSLISVILAVIVTR